MLACLEGSALVAEDGPKRVHELDNKKQRDDRKYEIDAVKPARDQRHNKGMKRGETEQGINGKQRTKTSKALLV